MSELALPPTSAILEIHTDLIEEHGGRAGCLDLGRLDAALARARNVMADGEGDPFSAIAALLSGIVNNNPFVDGNKRVAATVSIIALEMSGYELDVTNRDLAGHVEGLLTRKFTEEQVADWMRDNANSVA